MIFGLFAISCGKLVTLKRHLGLAKKEATDNADLELILLDSGAYLSSTCPSKM
jgi:hypothetical protein